jgi:hypothetical protein
VELKDRSLKWSKTIKLKSKKGLEESKNNNEDEYEFIELDPSDLQKRSGSDKVKGSELVAKPNSGGFINFDLFECFVAKSHQNQVCFNLSISGLPKRVF